MKNDRQVQIDVNKLHDRAREATHEYHKLLTQLSTGILAIYFLALTSSIVPPLTSNQQIAALCSLTFVGLAVFFGVLYWLGDALRNYYWGSSVSASVDEHNRQQLNLHKRKMVWQRVIRIATWGISISFLLGIGSSVWYMVLRLFNI